MKGFSVLIDFLNYAFFLLLIVFIIVFIILGDRLDLITNIIKTLIPISYVLLLFMLSVKTYHKKYEEFKKEEDLNEILIYFNKIDNIKDIIVTLILPVVIIFIANINEINTIDLFQATFSFIFMYCWHLVIFRNREDKKNIRFMTNFDVLKDKVIISLLPIIIMAIPLTQKFIDNLDILQALSVFFIMWIWRKILLFKVSKL